MPPSAKKRRPTDASPTTRRRIGEPWVVDDYLSYLLARASHVVSSAFHLEVRAAGLTVLEWRVLATLAGGGPWNVGQLASVALAQQSTVTKLLGRLEAEGRVERTEADHDRRQSLVRITPTGRSAIGPLLQRARQHEKLSMAGLEPRDVAALKRALKTLIAGR